LPTRRTFIGAATAWSAAAAWTRTSHGAFTSSQDVPRATRPLTLLFLGGTGFLGPHQIEHALARGHKVTMFNRGRNAGLFGDRVEELVGDRDTQVGEGLASLQGTRRFDVVIDNSGYLPRHVRDSAELLKDRCDRYLFVSTVAVYDYDAVPAVDGVHVVDRDGPLLAAVDTEERTGDTYGPQKAEGDRIVRQIYGARATVVRPCYVVGPGDTTDRFTYWVERVLQGGDVVCPAGPERAAQWIDARDLCPFIVKLAEDGTSGAFNGVGPASSYTNEAVLEGLRASAARPTTLHWAEAALLDQRRYPTPMFDRARSNRATDASAARTAGLVTRSLADTVRDLHVWWMALPEERRAAARGWPTAEQEAAVLTRLRG
jgi:2'-hydroxyisoflavone reductase